MSHITFGELYNNYKKENNIEDIYQPIIKNNELFFNKIGEYNTTKELLIHQVENDKRKMSFFAITYSEKDIEQLNVIDIIKMVIIEDNETEILKLSYAIKPISKDSKMISIDLSEQINCLNKRVDQTFTGKCLISKDDIIIKDNLSIVNTNKIVDILLNIYLE